MVIPTEVEQRRHWRYRQWRLRDTYLPGGSCFEERTVDTPFGQSTVVRGCCRTMSYCPVLCIIRKIESSCCQAAAERDQGERWTCMQMQYAGALRLQARRSNAWRRCSCADRSANLCVREAPESVHLYINTLVSCVCGVWCAGVGQTKELLKLCVLWSIER